MQFIINASQPASDKIFDVSAFEKFLHDKIKVDNRTGNLGDTIVISQQGDGKIEVVAHIPFSGRYLKYLYVSHLWNCASLTSQDKEIFEEATAARLASSG